MDLNLSQLSVAELADLRKRLENDLKNRAVQEKKAVQREHEEKRRAIVKQVHELVGAHGLSLDDVMKQRQPRGSRRTEDADLPKPPPKYRNPLDAAQTWAGKGRKPNWLVALLQQGRTLEEFAV
ncbi:DNA-binding protein H-NS [Gammaproteobacteria bacterium]